MLVSQRTSQRTKLQGIAVIKRLLAPLLVLVAHSALAATEVDIPYERFELDNGLRVIVHEDRKAPIVAVGVWYHVGSKD